MLNNIQNGGLICELEEQLLVTSLSDGIGLTLVQEEKKKYIHQILPWFMNQDLDKLKIYYSDGLKNNYLYKMDLSTYQDTLLVSEPTYLLQKVGQQLYYINEENKNLYSYHIQERRIRRIIEDTVQHFIIQDETLWYTNEKGIFAMELRTEHSEKINGSLAIRLVCEGQSLFYIDKKKDYAVCYMNTKKGQVEVIEGSMASSINAYGDVIFYNNVKDKSHIYRFSLENEFNLKFIPERAQYIHILNNKICYLNQDQKKWMVVPLQGGKPKCLLA